jgi:hypothetical protein
MPFCMSWFGIEMTVLAPYKGKSVVDAGAFYAPYVPLQMSAAKPRVTPKYRLVRRGKKWVVRTMHFNSQTDANEVLEWFAACNIPYANKQVYGMKYDHRTGHLTGEAEVYDYFFGTKSNAMAFILRWF